MLYSVKMRSAQGGPHEQGGRHISGAERILSEEKKEERGVIISMAELSKYFGKEVTPAKMKEQIIALLDEWKEKQPPELAQPDRKKDLEK